MKSMNWFGALLISALVSAPLALSCSVEAAQQEQNVTGSVTMALSSVTNGTEYRLANAVFEIDGATSAVLVSDNTQSVLSAVLPVGGYTSNLLPGWSLQRNENGAFVNVSATLVSANPAAFNISESANTGLVYQFDTDGTIINIGSGQLDISIAVNESGGPAACQAFGAGCAAGEWCVPGSLLGTANQCTVSGPLGVGEPCDYTVACGTNSLCGDIGLGQQCLELCDVTNYGMPCALGGGICNPIGYPDFGLCQ